MISPRFLLLGLCYSAHADIQNFCGGPESLLNIVNRPSYSDSVCVVPKNNILLEFGYQADGLIETGTAQNFAEPTMRVGLPLQSEFVIVMPNYITQNIRPHSGFTANTFGIKHVVGTTSKAMLTAEALFTAPGGSDAFGSQERGVAAYGIVAYSLTPSLTLSGFMGVSSQSTSKLNDGLRYTTFVPDVLLSWSHDRYSLYAELYAQTKTAPDAGSGVIFDVAMLYLVTNYWEVDVEVAHRLTGAINQIDYYAGIGTSLRFSDVFSRPKA